MTWCSREDGPSSTHDPSSRCVVHPIADNGDQEASCLEVSDRGVLLLGQYFRHDLVYAQVCSDGLGTEGIGFVPMADDWIPVVALGDLAAGTPIRAIARGSEVLLYRTGDRIVAASNRCTHQGAPLHRGVVRESGSILSVTCPLHGSTFQLTDGRVLRGPARESLPLFEVRVREDTVEVRPAS